MLINQPQTILHRKNGTMVPKEFLETALRKCPTVSGFAIREIVDGAPTIEVDTFDKAVTADNLMKLQEVGKDGELIMYLANFPGKFTLEDVQPFTFAVREKEEDQPQVVVAFCVEGDFSKFAKLDSGHTDEYNFAQDIILPMLEEYFTDAEGDIGKFTAKLHRPSFESSLKAHASSRCAFLFLPLEGDAIKFDHNELGGSFEWGEVSQAHDFNKPPVAAPITKTEPTVVAKATSKFSALFGQKTTPEGVHETTAVAKSLTKPEAKGEPPIIPATDTAIAAGAKWIGPPPKLDNSAKNMWLRLFNGGELPKNHTDKNVKLLVDPAMLPFATRECSTKENVKKLESDVRSAKKNQPVDMTKPATQLPASAVVPAVRKPADFVPDMTDNEMVEQTTILAGFVDRDKVPTALEIQKLEAKWPTYTEKMGIAENDPDRYTIADIMALCNGHKPSAMLILQYRRRALNAEGTKGISGASTTVKEVGGQQTKTVVKDSVIKNDKVEPLPIKGSETTAAAKRAFLFGKTG